MQVFRTSALGSSRFASIWSQKCRMFFHVQSRGECHWRFLFGRAKSYSAGHPTARGGSGCRRSGLGITGSAIMGHSLPFAKCRAIVRVDPLIRPSSGFNGSSGRILNQGSGSQSGVGGVCPSSSPTKLRRRCVQVVGESAMSALSLRVVQSVCVFYSAAKCTCSTLEG